MTQLQQQWSESFGPLWLEFPETRKLWLCVYGELLNAAKSPIALPHRPRVAQKASSMRNGKAVKR